MSFFNGRGLPKIFNFEKEGKGVYRDDLDDKNAFARYFLLLGRKFKAICALSLLTSVLVFPILVATFMTTYAVASHNQALLSNLLAAFPIIFAHPFLTAGFKVARDYTRQEPVFFFKDYFGALKANFLRSLVISVLSFITFVLLIWNLFVFTIQLMPPGWTRTAAIGIYLLFLLLFTMVSAYLPLTQVSVKLSLFKLIKNSLLFSILCFFKNLLMILVILLALSPFIFWFFYAIVFPPLMLPLVFITGFFLVGWIMFTISFFLFPNIKKYAIDPYYAANADKTAQGVRDKIKGIDEYDPSDDELPEYVYDNGRMVHRSVIENAPDKALFNEDEQKKGR